MAGYCGIMRYPDGGGLSALLRAGLLDELLICTHPAVLGFGGRLFDDYDVRIELDLLEQRSFERGVTMHRYAIRDAREASPC
jgi:dihydrofolate reductase